MSDVGSRHDVVVIGAGMAGLRCATDLVAAGFDVVVLEARERVGGRVWSHQFSNGQGCERGAEFIDGNHTEVLAIARDLGLALTERSADLDARATLVDAGGRAVPMYLHATLAPDWVRWEAAVASLESTDAFEQHTLGDLLHELGLSVMSRVVIGRDVRTEFMLPPEEVSQRFAAQVASNQVHGQRERHRVVGGNDLLARGLAERLGTRVRLGAAVSAVRADEGEVVLADGSVLTAGAVVATVPLPVLSRMWADMPPELGDVGYGVGGKISVQFSRRIWLDYSRNGTVLSDRAWGHLWETSDDQAGDTGVLTSLLSSHDGAAFVSLPEAPDRVVQEIERIFPGARGLAGERVLTDWTNDPHSLGAYTCFGPGSGPPRNPRCTPRTADCGSPASTPTASPGSWKVPCAAAPESLLASRPDYRRRHGSPPSSFRPRAHLLRTAAGRMWERRHQLHGQRRCRHCGCSGDHHRGGDNRRSRDHRSGGHRRARPHRGAADRAHPRHGLHVQHARPHRRCHHLRRGVPRLPVATTGADGSYDIEVPAGEPVTLTITADGHHSIRVQTFTLDGAGATIEGVNFQTPTDAIYDGLKALVGGFTGKDPFEGGCVIVTTVGDPRMVGMTFAEFIEFHPHGMAGATVQIDPPLATPVYFNDQVLPDAAQQTTSIDGGVLWPNVPPGEYTLSATLPGTQFVTVPVRCEDGWVVNANPVQGLHAIP